MILATREKLNMAALPELAEMDAQWLVQANFWILAARLLHDKGVSGFRSIDLYDLDNVFARVGKHYGSELKHDLSPRRGRALRAAVEILDKHSSLELVSTETLAKVYEEVLVTKETRKSLGTHSTPAWLVNYVVERIGDLLSTSSNENRLVFEPGCGHAPFLVSMLRLFAGMSPCARMDDVARHQWLRARLWGVETDDFAREVARLSLTLADIPNRNGWHLDSGDMFEGKKLIDRIRSSDVIISNPPFETRASEKGELFHVSQAAELLRLIASHSRKDTIVAYIMPQTILDSKKTADLRRELLSTFEWSEILRLPDKVFDKADVETAVLIGRKTDNPSSKGQSTLFKHVWDDDLRTFINGAPATVEQRRPQHLLVEQNGGSMLLPDLADVWDYCHSHEKLESVATVGHGMLYISEGKKNDRGESVFPAGETQRSHTRKAGYAQGFFNWEDAPGTHLHPKLQWMNENPSAIAAKRAGYATGIPQIVMNYVRVQRGPWRIKAYVDRVGRRACSDFLLVRPKSPNWSLNCLWALLNSPVANAFTFSFSAKKHIYSSLLLKMPVPALNARSAKKLDRLVGNYLKLAAVHQPIAARKSGRADSTAGFLRGLEPGNLGEDHSEALKVQLCRIDIEIFRLYGFPPHLERRILDYFTAYRRPGVPFEQRNFYPENFQGGQTLAELAAITHGWSVTNRRRLTLIEKEYQRGGLSEVERTELDTLQGLATLHRRMVAPYPMGDLNDEIARLKREGKWVD
jgi:hypothetical protein